jgi:hypothetical protein
MGLEYQPTIEKNPINIFNPLKELINESELIYTIYKSFIRSKSMDTRDKSKIYVTVIISNLKEKVGQA